MKRLILLFLVFLIFLLPHSQGQVMALEGLTPYFQTGRRVMTMPSSMLSSTRGFSVITRKVRMGLQKHQKPFVTFSSTTKMASSVNRRYFLFAEVIVRSSTRFKIRLTVKSASDGIRSWSLLSTIKFDYMAISSTVPNIYMSNTLDVIRGNSETYPKGTGQINTQRLVDWVGITPFSLLGSGVRFVWGVIYADSESMSSDNAFGMYLSIYNKTATEFETNLNSVYHIRIRQYKISLLIYDSKAFSARNINLKDHCRVVPAFGVNTIPQTLTWNGWPNFAGMQTLTGLAGFQFDTASYFAFESYIQLPVNPTVQITLYVANLAPTIAIPKLQITYLTVSQLSCPNKQPFLDNTLTICLTVCPAGSTPSTTPYGMAGLYPCSPCSGASCCPAGTYWSGAACLTCIINCAICSTSTNCIVCASGYALDQNGICILIPTCALPCTLCDGLACVACLAPYEVAGGTCQCPQDMIALNGGCSSCLLSIANCFSCDSTTACAQCSLMYYLTSTLTCARCVPACEICVDNTACIDCTVYATLQGSNLCTCDTGSFMNTTIQDCQACNPGCTACTATSCSQCADPNQVKSGTNCICPPGYYTDLTGVCGLCSTLIPQCTQCNSTQCSVCNPKFYLSTDKLTCPSCPMECATCISATICDTCEVTFVLVAGSCKCDVGNFFDGTNCVFCTLANCVECSSLTQCTVCGIGFYVSAITNQCEACTVRYGATCTSCDNLVCTVCTAPTIISSLGVCLCPTGQTLSGTTCVSCTSITSTCTTCTSTTTCTNCTSGFYLQSPTSCQPCPTGCMQCTAASCTRCLPTFTQDLIGVCVCLVGTYYDGVSACLSCNSAMAGCTECSSSAVCTLCGLAYYQSLGTTSCTACTPNCVQCDDSGCLTCQYGFVSALDTVSSKTICQDCKILFGASCLTCDLAKCTLCANAFFWLPSSNQCVSIDLLKCGDGAWIEQYEPCDDGNSVNGDGCNSLCQVQIDYECRPADKLLTGQSLCVFTKEISIAFDRLQKQPTSNVVNLFLKAEPSTFMQWNAQTIKLLLDPISIINQQTGATSVIPLQSVNILFTRDQTTNQIKVVIDYGQNNLQGSSLKFNLNPLNTNLPSLKYTAIQGNLLLPIDNSRTSVYLYGYSEDVYAAQGMISNVCTGIGLLALMMAVVGMFAPTGKIIIIEALAVVQLSFFSVLQYQKIPPTFIGFKDLILSNGYNNQNILPQTNQQAQSIYKLMGINVNALSNYNIALILFVVMPSLIGGIGLLASKFLSKTSNPSTGKQQLPTNQTTIAQNNLQKKQKEEPNQTECKDSLKHSKAQSIIDKLNSSRFNNLQSPASKNSPDKLHKVTMDQSLIANKNNNNLPDQNPSMQNISLSKVIFERILYENTFYGLFMTSYLAWISTFYSFKNFEATSIAVILIQITFLGGFGFIFVKSTAQRISLDKVLGKDQQNKASKKQQQNDKQLSVSTKFGEFNQLCMQRLQNPCNLSLKVYSKLSLLFLAERLISSLCIVLLSQSMAFTGAIIIAIYFGLLAIIIVINKKLNSFEEENNKKKLQEQKQIEEKPNKVFIQIVERPLPKVTKKSISALNFFYQNYVFRQGINFGTIILIQLLFLFANITMTSQDPYETFANNLMVTKFIPFIVLGLLALNMLFNLFLFVVEIKQSLLLAKIKTIIGHYYPQSRSLSKLAQENKSNKLNDSKQPEQEQNLKSNRSGSQKQEDQMVNMLNKFLQKSEMLQTKESPFIGIQEKQVKEQALINLFKIEQAHKVKMSEAGKDIRNKLISDMWDQI